MCDTKDQVQMRTAAPLDLKSVKPFKTKDEYLYAMKEDLAEWFNDLYALPINVDNFFEHLDSGTLLCRHANTVQSHMSLASDLNSNENHLVYRHDAQPGTFRARDNISIFIGWCRKVLEIRDTLLFETEDIVARKNERNVILGILEVARKGAKFGVLAPQLIQLEQEIDEEIELEKNPGLALKVKSNVKMKTNRSDLNNVHKKAEKKYIEVDMMSLDEMVRLILSRCKCEHQYPMIRMSEGRYTHGNDKNTIFLRVLRRHVMVRTGGGWDTLESYLDRHDPCRCNSKEHRGSLAFRNQQKGENNKKENGDGRPKSFLGSMDSMPSSESSLSESRNKSSKSSSNRQSNIREEPLTSDDLIEDISTLSLLKDVVHLIETKHPVSADIKFHATPLKIKERPISSKHTPSSSKTQIVKETNRSVVRKSLANILPKTPVANSKSLCSSRESLLSNRRKSDIFGLGESRRSSLLPETTKSKIRPNSSTPSRALFNSATRTPERKRILPNVNNLNNLMPSKSLNTSCENLDRRRRSEFVSPRKMMTPSKSFQAYDDAKFKKPTNPPPRTRYVTPKRPASAQSPASSIATKSITKTRKSLDFSKCSQSLENLTEDAMPLKHFQSQEAIGMGCEKIDTTPRSKPRKDIDGGLKTRIPAPVRHIKFSENLKRADSGVDITGGPDFIDPTPQKNKFFDDGDYY